MIDTTSPIVGTGGTIAEAFAYASDGRPITVYVIDYIKELHRLCELVGFDFRLLFGQAWLETGGFTSKWWLVRRNPAGIGITGDPAQNAASHTWDNGTDAARAHVAHMIAYVDPVVNLTVIDALKKQDPRFQSVIYAGYAGTVKKLGDLGSGKWATDPDYAAKIANRANAIFTEEPMTDLTFGKVPYPAVIASHLSADNPWVNGGAPDNAHVEAVFWHRMIGSWEGTNGWFHAGKAATAYGVAVAATDGNGGAIYEWIAPGSGLYGESSGPAVGPYGDGQKLIAKVGVNSVNRTTKAIEISGNYDTPLDEAARTAIVNLTAYFADQRHIPWDEFPNVPGEDRSFVCWHNEITGLTYKQCPGTVVMEETSALIARVAAVLKRYQGAGTVVVKPPTYAAPVLPDWWAESIEQPYPTDNSFDGMKYAVIRRNYVVTHATRRLSAPDGKAKPSGPNLKVREKVHGERLIDNKWVLSVDGHHIAANRLSPRITVRS